MESLNQLPILGLPLPKTSITLLFRLLTKQPNLSTSSTIILIEFAFTIRFIRKYDEEIKIIPNAIHKLVDTNEDTDFIRQIHLSKTFQEAVFLSVVSLMGEIDDFSVFSKLKQLFAYFGLDPAVKHSGKFEGTKIIMSKSGSDISIYVIHTLALQSISTCHSGELKNLVLRGYSLT